MNRTGAALVGVAVASWLIAGCSSVAPSPASRTSSAPATPVVTPAPATPRVTAAAAPTPVVTSAPTTVAIDVTAFLPAGTYSAEVPAGLEAGPGTWTLEIGPDGLMWTNPENGATFSPGRVVELTSSTIVLGPDSGCPGQDGGPTAGTYEWQLDAGQLAFTLVSDSCAGRSDTLTASPWTLVPSRGAANRIGRGGISLV
jgi:hypothetical protein